MFKLLYVDPATNKFVSMKFAAKEPAWAMAKAINNGCGTSVSIFGKTIRNPIGIRMADGRWIPAIPA